jgi:hypothetical protein
VRFCLSSWLVEIWAWSGLPAITVRSAPVTPEGITAWPDRLGIVKFNDLPVVHIYMRHRLRPELRCREANFTVVPKQMTD